eukprot:6721007-Prymnesium_polylepis.1
MTPTYHRSSSSSLGPVGSGFWKKLSGCCGGGDDGGDGSDGGGDAGGGADGGGADGGGLSGGDGGEEGGCCAAMSCAARSGAESLMPSEPGLAGDDVSSATDRPADSWFDGTAPAETLARP